MNQIGDAISSKLNKHCHCITLDKVQLKNALDNQVAQAGFAAQLEASHPHLFCNTATFISHAHLQDMKALIKATRNLAALKPYQEWAFSQADLVARHMPKHDSVFFGYDFHIDAQRVSLIEINTNAGGGLLNALLTQAQLACCDEVSVAFNSPQNNKNLTESLLTMFITEWRLARGNQPLQSIAILDDRPEKQGLYPEFLLFKSLFEQKGIRAVIASPDRLRIEKEKVWVDDLPIDIIYSRLTDFYFIQPEHSLLRQAWLNDNAVITPHPYAYALYADKRCMTVMSEPEQLAAWGVTESDREIFARYVPLTRKVTLSKSEKIWQERKHYFFKPAQGFGSKATYRGDKITRKVFESLLQQGDYVMQAFNPPGQRCVQIDGGHSELKFDIRAYVYQGEIQLLAARVYQGQTTNLRTSGGGFSGVFVVK